MKTGRYSLKELLTHNEIDQVIIPEIQRDYVWQQVNVERLLSAIREHFSKKERLEFGAYVNQELILEPNLVSYLKKEYERLVYHVKIGFIYAYHDLEYAGKFFLIDGQQRLTSLYLLLLALYKKTGRGEEFRSVYFKNNQLRIDYKVREASHDFMVAFVQNELVADSRDIKQNNAYYKNYDEDTTICNLIANYKHIQHRIAEMPDNELQPFTYFIEEFVEVNYFDTSLSEQGEQLYLYMNSRGEDLSFQERIKSEIVLKESETDKKKAAGHEWENWQNFFWQHRFYWTEKIRLQRENADVGFQEFLKWATILQIFNGDHKRPEEFIHRIQGRVIFQTELLEKYQLNSPAFSFVYLQKLANTLSYLYDKEVYGAFKPFLRKSYLANHLQTIDYVIICPLLYFIAHSNWEDVALKQRDVIRMGMFLKNITYFASTVGRAPDTATIDLLKMVKILCDLNLTDITGFLDPLFDRKFRNILTPGEMAKLRLLSRQGREDSRAELEEFIWKITNDAKISGFLEGNITILFDCVALDLEVISHDQIIELGGYYSLLQRLIADHFRSDILRRAMLTFDDYALQESGGTYRQEYIHKFSFVSDNGEWRRLFAHLDQKLVLIEFIKDLYVSLTDYRFQTIQAYFHELINAFTDTNDWRYAFIRLPQIMAYCQQKKILFQNHQKIILLSKTIMSADYCEIQLMVFIANFGERAKYHHRACYINTGPGNSLVVKYEQQKWTVETRDKDDILLTTAVLFFEDTPGLSIMANVDLALSAFESFSV